MIRTTLSIAAILVSSGAAIAGPYDAPAAPPPVIVPLGDPFDGFYFGGSYALGQGDGVEDAGALGTRALTYDDATGYGIFAGYNVQNGNIVYGGELRALQFQDYALNFASANPFEIESVIDLRARVGYVMGNLMIYGAAGYSMASVNDPGSSAFDLTGYNIGAGLEYHFTDTFFVRADYTMRELTGSTALNSSVDQTLNTASIGIGIRF